MLQMPSLPTGKGDPITDRSTETFIKFQVRSDYDCFVEQLKAQLKVYATAACEQTRIPMGSADAKAVENILMDVFMKYTLEFMRENLVVEGSPLSPPPEFASASGARPAVTSGKPQQPSARLPAKDAKQPVTRPYDAALNERVIRQQYALYDAAVDNTRKRKDIAGHIVQRVESAAAQVRETLLDEAGQVERLEQERIAQSSVDPRHRWEVVNADLPDLKRIQEDYTDTNKVIADLMESLPQLIGDASRAIDLHKEVSSLLNNTE